MNTTIINLFGGPGCGKSTLAASLFADLKVMGRETELIREYVKGWVWRGIRPQSSFDQIYIFAKQVKAETDVLGKVEFAIAECPALLAPVYELHYHKTELVTPIALAYYRHLEGLGINQINFLLRRGDTYQATGRYEDEISAQLVDLAIERFLSMNQIPYEPVIQPFGERHDLLMGKILGGR